MSILSRLLASEPPGPIARRRRTPRRPRPVVARHDVPRVVPVRLRGRDIGPRQRALTWRDRVLPDVLIVLLLFAISFGQNMVGVRDTFFHPDESRWLNRAYYAREVFDPFGPTWGDYVTTIGQPPLGSYVMGIGLALQGRPLDRTGSWDFAYDEDWNTNAGAMPSEADLAAGRQTNAVVGALVVVAIYWMGRRLTNRVGGLLGGLFLAFHPLHITLSSQALSDEAFALTLVLAFLAAWSFAKRPTWARAILLGVLLGLGGAAKLSPLLLSLPLAAFGVLRLLLDRDRAARDYALKLVLQPVIAFATFVIAYPYLWPSPIRRTWELFQFRSVEMQAQAAAWPELAVTSPLDALGRFGQGLTYTDSTTQRFAQSILDAFGINRTASGVDFIPVAAGVILLVWWVIRRGLWTPTALVSLLMAAEAGAIIVGMGTDFYRYHLPIVAIMAVCIAVSGGAGWTWLSRWLATHRHPASRRPKAHLASAAASAPGPTTRHQLAPEAIATLSAPSAREPGT